MEDTFHVAQRYFSKTQFYRPLFSPPSQTDVTREVALKAIPKKKVKGNEESVWSEMRVLQGLDHPNTVRPSRPISPFPHRFTRSTDSARAPFRLISSFFPTAIALQRGRWTSRAGPGAAASLPVASRQRLKKLLANRLATLTFLPGLNLLSPAQVSFARSRLIRYCGLFLSCLFPNSQLAIPL
jgi:hypothetical protein